MFQLARLYTWALTWDARKARKVAGFLARAGVLAKKHSGYFDRHLARYAYVKFMSPLFQWYMKTRYSLRLKLAALLWKLGISV